MPISRTSSGFHIKQTAVFDLVPFSMDKDIDFPSGSWALVAKRSDTQPEEGLLHLKIGSRTKLPSNDIGSRSKGYARLLSIIIIRDYE